jgi:GT2 family glycosyltransferase
VKFSGEMSVDMIQILPSVAVILVNYNGLEDTVECLASLRAITYPNFSVIVIDNGSSVNPIPMLSAEFPEVRFVRSEKNLGFTGGNNLGLANALEGDPKYVLFLNNDTVSSPNLLSSLVEFMEGNPDVGIAGPLTFYYDAPEIVYFWGGNLDRNTGRITFIGRGKPLPESSGDVVYCNFIEGAAIFIRADLIRTTGGFNDDYFLTSEESELCIKVADMGYRLAVLTSCPIFHKVSSSMGEGSELMSYFVYRNRLHFIKNNVFDFKFKDFVTIISIYLRTFASMVVKEHNIPAARGLLIGVYDFFRGVKGPGRYKERLQA